MQNRHLEISETYRAHIALWKTSGQNKIKFCLSNQINYTSFLYFFKKFEPPIEDKTFRQINVTNFKSDESCLFTLLYPNNCALKIHPPVDAQFLNQLVALCK